MLRNSEQKESDGSEIYIDVLSQQATRIATELKATQRMSSDIINKEERDQNIQYWKDTLKNNLENLQKNLSGPPNAHVTDEKNRWEKLLKDIEIYEKSLTSKSLYLFKENKCATQAIESSEPTVEKPKL